MEIQKTALYNYHKSLGAKFVPFAGYEMPVQYSSGVIEEHKMTRNNAGLFDVSHMGQLSIEGSRNLAEELEKIIPIDLEKIKLNQSKYSFLTNENGGICDDLIVTRVENGFNIILNAACKNSDFKIFKNSLGNKFKLTLHKNLSLIALQGPNSSEILEKIIPKVSSLKFMNGNKFSFSEKSVYVTRSGYTGEDGFEISLPDNLAENFAKRLIEQGAKPIGLGARDTDDIARLYSGRGEVSLKVEVTDKVKEGIVFTTFHFPEHMVNMVTGHGKDEETKCAEYKVSSVEVQKISNQFKTEVSTEKNQAEVTKTLGT